MASSATATSGANIVPRRLQGPIAAATEELHQQHQQQTHESGPGAGVGGQAQEQDEHEHEHEQQQEHVGLGPSAGVSGQTQQQQQQQHMGFGPVGGVGGQYHGIATVEESSISSTTYYNLNPFAIAVIVIVTLVFVVPIVIVFFQRIVVRQRKSRAAAKHLMNDLDLTMTSHERYHGRRTTYSSHSLSSIGSSFSSAGSSCDGFENSIAAIFQSNANTTTRTTALDNCLKTIISGGGRRVSFLSTNSEEEQNNLKTTGLSDVV